MSPDYTLTPISFPQSKHSDKSVTQISDEKTKDNKFRSVSPSKRGKNMNKIKNPNLRDAISTLYKKKQKQLDTIQKNLNKASIYYHLMTFHKKIIIKLITD